MNHKLSALESNLKHLKKMLEVGKKWVAFIKKTEPNSDFYKREEFRARLIQQSIRDTQYRIKIASKRNFKIEYYATLHDYRNGIKSEANIISVNLKTARLLLRKRLGRIYIINKPFLS